MIKRVFRVEWPNGRGCYQNMFGGSDEQDVSPSESVGMEDRVSSAQHPGPENDPVLAPVWKSLQGRNESYLYSFGFSSWEQTATWFYKKCWMTRLDNLGLVLSEYLVDPDQMFHGEKQAVFRREHALLIHRHKMVCLWPLAKQLRNERKTHE